MKNDPDSAEIKVKWYWNRWLFAAGAASWVGIELLYLKLSDHRGSVFNIIGALGVGVVLIGRVVVRPVVGQTSGSEARRLQGDRLATQDTYVGLRGS
jgi:hypothetical protein